MLGLILFCMLMAVCVTISIAILRNECHDVGDWIGGILLAAFLVGITGFFAVVIISATTGFMPIEEGHAEVYIGNVEYGGLHWKDYQAEVFCGEVKNNSKFTVTTHRHDLGKELSKYSGKKVRITYRRWFGMCCPVWLGGTDKELTGIELLESPEGKE